MSRKSDLPSNGIFSVGENKLESSDSEETTSFNGIVTVGVLGEEAGLLSFLGSTACLQLGRDARAARCRL